MGGWVGACMCLLPHFWEACKVIDQTVKPLSFPPCSCPLHHSSSGGKFHRRMVHVDSDRGIVYLNAATVPRVRKVLPVQQKMGESWQQGV